MNGPTSPEVRAVLVADDFDDLREQLVRAFRRRGLASEGAASHEAALTLALEASFDLAVVDLRLGADSGLELVRDLKRLHPEMRVVVLTGYGSIASALQAMRLGAHDYLTKPADADEILAAARAHPEPLDARPGPSAAPSLARAEWEHIQRVLSDCGGNISHAADKLGIHRRSLQRKLQRPPRA